MIIRTTKDLYGHILEEDDIIIFPGISAGWRLHTKFIGPDRGDPVTIWEKLGIRKERFTICEKLYDHPITNHCTAWPETTWSFLKQRLAVLTRAVYFLLYLSELSIEESNLSDYVETAIQIARRKYPMPPVTIPTPQPEKKVSESMVEELKSTERTNSIEQVNYEPQFNQLKL